MRVRFETLGCRLNTSEIEQLTRQLAAAGHAVASEDEPSGQPVDLCIFNSCAVTATAARKSRHAIRQLRRRYPGAALVVTGCLAELSAGEVRALGVDLVVGNRDKERLPELLITAGLLAAEARPAGGASGLGFAAEPQLGRPGPGRHTRAFLKVQDGCDNQCAYCVVTIARGPGRSVRISEVVKEARWLQRSGYQEVVLTGVHLGSYGRDLEPAVGLEHLVEQLLAETSLARLRLSSVEPWDLTPGLLALFRDRRLQPHLHLPLQSGCDATLRRMCRRISAKEYKALVEEARSRIPDLAISTDIMVGFPGETAEEHQESFAFVERMAFSRLHVFRYSRRTGTPAAAMPGAVDGSVAQQRSQSMQQLAARLAERFARSCIGQTVPVLWEECSATADGLRWQGLTPSYLRVWLSTGPDSDLANRITATRLESLAPGGVVGALV